MVRSPVALVLAAVAVPFALFGCGGNGSSTMTLHVIEHADTDTLQHVGPANEKDSIGDVLGFANPLYDFQIRSR